MAERKTIVYPNPEMLAQAVAARTLLTIIDLLAEPGRRRVDIAVTGGTDGNRVFAAMNASPLNDAVDWNRVHVWWGDERFVRPMTTPQCEAGSRSLVRCACGRWTHACRERPCDACRHP